MSSSADAPPPSGTWVPSTAAATTLIMLRHGVTEYTLGRRYAGVSDLPLVEQGHGQAAAAAGALAREPIEAIVSSPLTRCLQTARPTAARLGLAVNTHPGLAETNFGDWEGRTFAEVSQAWPDELEAWLADAAVAPPGGESFDQVTERVVRAREEIVRRYEGRTVLLVSHVTPIKTLVRLAIDAPVTALHRMHLNPASISKVTYFSDGNVSMTLFNETAHLRG